MLLDLVLGKHSTAQIAQAGAVPPKCRVEPPSYGAVINSPGLIDSAGH